VKVVLDANVLVAAFAVRGLCEAVYQTCLGEHEIVASEYLLGEVRRALRGKLKLRGTHADEIVALLRENAVIVNPAEVETGACRDPQDLPVLGTVIAGNADCLVTGDQDLLALKTFRSIPILSPRAFHDWLQ
jgi:putative PIN family toxin of toxin-antitoxin system